jgi:hypothetical protein
MALTTRAALKIHLGIQAADTTQDAALDARIREASAAVRSFCGRWLGGAVQFISTGASPTITCLGHSLKTGDTVYFVHSNCSPTLDGQALAITVSDEDTFTVTPAAAVTTAGTSAWLVRSVTEYLPGTGSRELLLRHCPVRSITSVYEDSGAYYGEASGAFAASTLLTAGTDYCLARDNAAENEVSRSGVLLRIGGYWPRSTVRSEGMLAASAAPGLGNVKVTYLTGWAPIPADLRAATHSLAVQMMQGATVGGPLQSESLDYYSYQLATAAKGSPLGSVRQLLSQKYKELVA